MKYIKILSICALSASLLACNPIEDVSLREKYVNGAGTPISTAELTKALTIEQPFPNMDGVVEGDQIIVFNNARKDVGGNWHFQWGAGEKIVGSDNNTITYQANGDFYVYYQGISEGKIVTSEKLYFSVSNVFLESSTWLTGAVDKADKTASKVWGLRKDCGKVCDMCAHGFWKYASAGYTPESFTGISWWAAFSFDEVGDETMEFFYDGSKAVSYDKNGNKRSAHGEGHFDYAEDHPEDAVVGVLKTDVMIPAQGKSDCGVSGAYYVLRLTDKYMTLYDPSWCAWGAGGDWDDCGWRVVLEAQKVKR